jgi:hypothetical protein
MLPTNFLLFFLTMEKRIKALYYIILLKEVLSYGYICIS